MVASMYLVSKMAYAIVITFVGGGIALGCYAKVRRWDSQNGYFRYTEGRAPSLMSDLASLRGMAYMAFAVGALVGTLYALQLLLVTHYQKLAGLMTVVVATITAKRYFFVEPTPQLSTQGVKDR